MIKASIARICACSRALSSPLGSLTAATKKPRDSAPGLLCFTSIAKSILRDDRAAEPVVQAGGDEIDVLTDAIGAEGSAGRRGEVIGTVLHEQVIVLDANRPVRGEGVFEASADRAAPAGVIAGDASERAADSVLMR